MQREGAGAGEGGGPSVSVPGQVQQGLLGVVTGVGTALIEDQAVLLGPPNREGAGGNSVCPQPRPRRPP